MTDTLIVSKVETDTRLFRKGKTNVHVVGPVRHQYGTKLIVEGSLVEMTIETMTPYVGNEYTVLHLDGVYPDVKEGDVLEVLGHVPDWSNVRSVTPPAE